tara:strand:+ start:88 stop:747 length:660 start_codon:yes stop_codon:yes gene_type:complete
MVKYNKDFQDVPSALTFLTSDGVTGANILNGKINASGSKFDKMDATESNLMKAMDTTGYDLPKTNINDYKKVASDEPSWSDYLLGRFGFRQGTGFSTMDRYRSLYERRNSLKGKEKEEFIKLDNLLKTSSGPKIRNKKTQEQPNYGDMIPRIPEGYKEPTPMKKENIPFNPIFRPGMDPMGLPNRRPNMMPNNMVQNRGNNKTLVKLATVNRLFPGLIS